MQFIGEDKYLIQCLWVGESYEADHFFYYVSRQKMDFFVAGLQPWLERMTAVRDISDSCPVDHTLATQLQRSALHLYTSKILQRKI